jgi:hypothetical protein
VPPALKTSHPPQEKAFQGEFHVIGACKAAALKLAECVFLLQEIGVQICNFVEKEVFFE